MNKIICAFLCGMLSLTVVNVQSQTTLEAGDIAIVSYIAIGTSDSIAFVVLREVGIEVGTELYFTDNGWIYVEGGSSYFRTGEGILKWTCNKSLVYGEVVRIWCGSSSAIGSDKGTCENIFSTVSLSVSGDQIFVFQGGTWPQPSKLITGLHFNRTAQTTDQMWDTGENSSNASSLPNKSTGASVQNQLSSDQAVWIRDKSVGTSLKARAAIWKGASTMNLFSTAPVILRSRINNPDNWTDYVNNVGESPGWLLPSSIIKSPLSANSTEQMVRCNGGRSGSAQVFAQGGNGNYSYKWSPYGGATNRAEFLYAGTYSCVIKDGLGESITVNVVIQEPGALAGDIVIHAADCNGTSSGSLEAMVTGGVGNYTYKWKQIASSAPIIENLVAGYYEVLVNDQNGCNFKTGIQLPVGEVGEIVLPGMLSTCPNIELDLSAISPAGGVFTGITVNNLIFNVPTSGEYPFNYNIQGTNGCTASQYGIITVGAKANLALSEVPDLCANDAVISLQFVSPIGGVYTGNGVDGQGFNVSVVGPGTHEVVYVLQSEEYPCMASLPFNIVVNAPTPIDLLDSVFFCQNDAVSTLPVPSPAGGVYSGIGVLGSEFSPFVHGVGTNQIRYSFINEHGCMSQDSMIVTVYEIIEPSLINDIKVCADVPAFELNISSISGGTYSGEAIVNNHFHPGLAGVGPSEVYYTYINSKGCSASDTTVINVQQINKGVLAVASTSHFCAGDSVLIQVEGLDACDWFRNNELIDASGANELSAKTAGDYHVVPKTGVVCPRSSNQVSVEVYDLPKPTVLIPADSRLCVEEAIELSTQIFDFYQWELEGVNIPNATTSVHLVQNSGAFKVKVIDQNGCSGMSNSVVINQNNRAVLDLVEGAFLCNGDSLKIRASKANEYNWYLNNELISTGLEPIIHVHVPGSYYAILKDSTGCEAQTATVELQNYPVPNPVISVAGDLAFCEGGTNKLIAGSYTSYQWYRNSSILTNATEAALYNGVSGEFTVSVIDENKCAGTSAPVQVTVYPLPNVDLSSESFRQVCQGDSLTLGAVGENESAYQWHRNGGEIVGATSNDYVVNQIGLYHLEAVSSFGCRDSSKKILVNFYEPPQLPVITQVTENLLLSSSLNHNQWLFNGQLLVGDTNQTVQIESVGTYKLRVYAAPECFRESMPWEMQTTGMFDNHETDKQLSIYPNPMLDQANVLVAKTGVYLVTDLSGRVVLELSLLAGNNIVKLAGLSPGYYLIKDQEGRSTAKQFVKM